MPRLICEYSGICLYLAKASEQSTSESGGTMPATGFHSVIDRPESVKRVAPPTSTIAAIIAATTYSQLITGR